MATSDREKREKEEEERMEGEEEQDEERRGEGREEEEEGETIFNLKCSNCGYGHRIPCVNCGQLLSQQQVNVRKAGNLISGDTVFIDIDYWKEGETFALKMSPEGQLYMDKVRNLIIAHNMVTVSLGSKGEVKVDVVSDLQQLKKAPDTIFILKTDWSSATDEPDSSTQKKEVILTQIINKGAEDFLDQVFKLIQDAKLPQEVTQNLYNKFRLRLLGLTKDLQVLLQGSAEQVENLSASQHRDIQQELNRFMPEAVRHHLTWKNFSHIPVQCSDRKEEHRPEVVQGAAAMTCRYGNQLGLEKLLRDPHVNVRSPNTDGQTLFHIACRYGQSHLLDILQRQGAAIHERDSQEWSPLHLACGPDITDEEKRLKTVEWLLSHGADASALNGEGHTAVEVARKEGVEGRVVELLVNGMSSARAEGGDD